MLIQNYGLFWRRYWVHFGYGGNAGHLKGIKSGAKKSGPVDFRYQQGVYCLYDENFKMVYAGQAGGKNNQRLFDRLKQHTEDFVSDRWTRFSWFGIRRVSESQKLSAESVAGSSPSTDHVLNHIEAILIAAAEPLHNKQGGRFGEKVDQYLQYRDRENLGPDKEEMIYDIWQNIHKQE